MPRQLLGLHVLAGTVPARSMRHFLGAKQFNSRKEILTYVQGNVRLWHKASGECRENQEIIALGVSDLIHVKAGRQPGHYAARQKEKRRMSCGIGAIGQCLISSSTHYS
jgi:hypothetical protein